MLKGFSLLLLVLASIGCRTEMTRFTVDCRKCGRFQSVDLEKGERLRSCDDCGYDQFTNMYYSSKFIWFWQKEYKKK